MLTELQYQCVQQVYSRFVATNAGRKSKKEDTFGMKDEDWNVYKEIVSIVPFEIEQCKRATSLLAFYEHTHLLGNDDHVHVHILVARI